MDRSRSISFQGGKMQNSRDTERCSLVASLAAIGGEPLAGSGFEAEEPDAAFSATELGGEA
jgi:hypothetical protein